MADELGIKIDLEVFMDLNELNINSYELTRILGILMNNAIEASKECDEKIINVTFRKDKRKNVQLIIVENTYKDKEIDTEKIYEKGFSTKQGNTGLGLWEIRQILKKHNNLNLYTTKNDEFFIQQFEIYY
jgi:two-component system sensor histidine kinase AgrC